MKKKLLTAIVLIFIAFAVFLVMSDMNNTNQTTFESETYVIDN